MATGFGRRLDWVTLLAVIRLQFVERGETAFTLRFTERGWTSWWGTGVPDEDDLKWFATDDAAALALIAGNAHVPGVDDD
jgi:hypothetical protein